MIDRRELLEKARERNLSLAMTEKDYVLGWLLRGFASIPDLVFKGGTALSKVYFPGMWRLSEDLDFSLISGEWEKVQRPVAGILKDLAKESGIRFKLASEFSNPGYLQLKIQYQGPIGRNWVKADVRKDDLVDKPAEKKVARSYSDYPEFTFAVESLEEICASKIRTLVERRKCRDYFDLWKMLDLKLDRARLARILPDKMAVKGLKVPGSNSIFPADLTEIIRPYWERELSRLVHHVPELEQVLTELEQKIGLLLIRVVDRHAQS